VVEVEQLFSCVQMCGQNFQTQRPLTGMFDMLIHLDTILFQFEGQSLGSQEEIKSSPSAGVTDPG